MRASGTGREKNCESEIGGPSAAERSRKLTSRRRAHAKRKGTRGRRGRGGGGWVLSKKRTQETGETRGLHHGMGKDTKTAIKDALQEQMKNA